MATTAPAAPAAQGLASNDVESLIAELSSLPTTAAFRLFLQRAQALITGLVYVSILVLPRKANASEDGKRSTKNKKSGNGGGSTSNNLNNEAKNGGNTTAFNSPLRSQRNGSTLPGAVSEKDYLVLPGTTADGSDLEAWQRVNSALENKAACGLDWGNSCVYELIDKEINRNIASDGGGGGDGGVLLLASEPEYPLPSTAAFHAATKSLDGIICNQYDAFKGPHYADWQQLATVYNTQSFASLPMYISTSTVSSNNANDIAAAANDGTGTSALLPTNSDQVLVGVLTLASTDPHAFESSRLVWLLAMALAPLAAQLTYAEPALRFENFIGRVMPALLKENYFLKTTGKKKENVGRSSHGALAASSTTSAKQKKKQKKPVRSSPPSQAIGNRDDTGKSSFTTGGLDIREKSQLHDKGDLNQTEILEFVFSLASMSIVFVAFWHATLIHSSSSSENSGTGHGIDYLPILKFIAGADILRLAITWIIDNAILPAQKRKENPLTKTPSISSTSPISSPRVNALKTLGIVATRAVLELLSRIHQVFLLPMSHCWMVLFVYNKLFGGISLHSWQLWGPFLGFCWQMQTLVQDVLQSSISTFVIEKKTLSDFDVRFTKEKQIYVESVFLAAASAGQVCTAGFDLEVTSYECLAVVTGVQVALEQLVPSAMGILVILLRRRINYNNNSVEYK